MKQRGQPTRPLSTGLVAVVTLSSAILVLLYWAAGADHIARQLQVARPLLDGIRLLVLAALIALWGPLVASRGRRRGLSPATIAVLARQRWALALLLLAIEWGLVHNLPGLSRLQS